MQIVWELVSEIEEQQEMAERARDKVVSKLQEALAQRALDHSTVGKASTVSSWPLTQGAILEPLWRECLPEHVDRANSFPLHGYYLLR